MIPPAARFADIELSLIRQINALATPLSLNLGIGEPNIEPDEHLRELARRAASSGSWHYTANAGSIELRNLIAKDAGSPVDGASEVCVTPGTQEALYAIAQAFIGPRDEVLVPDPGFLSYPALVKLAGGTPVPYPLEPLEWTIDLDALTKRITSKTKMIVINSPANPTGGMVGEAALDAIAKIATERNILVVCDEVYREIHYGERPPSMLGRSPHAIVVSGMSKSHALTGLRIGWAIASRDLMPHIVKAHQYIATCASAFSQSLAAAILCDTEWSRGWLEKVRDQFETQREFAIGSVKRDLEIDVPPPPGAFYLFVPVPTCDTVGFAKSLATDAAVLTVPGVAFGRGGEGFLRLSYAASPEVIQHGIERIGRYLREHGR